MAGKQISFYLTEDEHRRLFEVALQQCRRPHEQARFMVLYALGLVTSDADSIRGQPMTVISEGDTPTNAQP